MRVLAVGAHPDDIELGCGGALLAHRRGGDEVALLVMTNGKNGAEDGRCRVSEQEDAATMLGARLLWGGFEDGSVDDERAGIGVVENALRATKADVVYTHCPRDTHQDHRATATATLAAARKVSRVLSYEAPSSVDFSPSFYVDVDGLVEQKLDLVRCHISQVLKNGLVDLEAVEAQARYRGFVARGKVAEGFEVHRFTWDLDGADRRDAAGRTEVAGLDVDMTQGLERTGRRGPVRQQPVPYRVNVG